MNRHQMMVCATIVAILSIIASGQKTQVSVQKGKVVAETANQSVTIDAGRKAVLAADGKPVVTVDNPLVNDALQLHKLVEAERKAGKLRIDSTYILVGRADENRVLGAIYMEAPNAAPAATDTLTLSGSALENVQIYDLKGNLCPVDIKPAGQGAASYSIHFLEPVPPGGRFELIGVSDLKDLPMLPGGAPSYHKEGPLWYFRTFYEVPYGLTYYRFILSASAILVDTNRQVIATDSVDDRVAVTIRNYTGPYADGWCILALMSPERDGTTLADIPPEYYGLRATGQKNDAETWQREMTKVRAGVRIFDHNTPVLTVLSACSAAIRRDVESYCAVLWKPLEQAQEQRYLEQAAYWASILAVLDVPDWPQDPGNGYVHPVWLSRQSSLIHEFTSLVVWQDAKWYSYATNRHNGAPETAADAGRIEKARTEGYLTDWQVAGPYVQRDKKAAELFDIAFGPELPGKDVRWTAIPTETLGKHPAYVDLDKALYNLDQAVAYLRTQIPSTEEKSSRLEIYTDDGVKAWLNGTLIHANNVSRGIPEQPDVVPVTLKQGSNDLLLKVTEDVFSWGAIVRLQPADGNGKQ